MGKAGFVTFLLYLSSKVVFQADSKICSALEYCNHIKMYKERLGEFPKLNLEANRDTLCKLGLQTGFIPDSAITGSSYWDSAQDEKHVPSHGRLDRAGHPSGTLVGAWVALNQVAGEWIQVEVQKPTTITGVITQGRNYGAMWVTKFKVEYKTKIHESWTEIRNKDLQNEFWGNSDENTKVMNMFENPVEAIQIRIVVPK